MSQRQSLDRLVKERLKGWGQRPPGLTTLRHGRSVWLCGRPTATPRVCHPYLKVPGSIWLRTVPDGLFLNFGGTVGDAFVDILAVEACSTLENLRDKRSRFTPSLYALQAVCPVPWLLLPAIPGDPTPRWEAIGVFMRAPLLPAVFSIRQQRVLYLLKRNDYERFKRHHLAHPHEYFAPMDALINDDPDQQAALHALLQRASGAANFLDLPDGVASWQYPPPRPSLAERVRLARQRHNAMRQRTPAPAAMPLYHSAGSGGQQMVSAP
jgi:hypothetical protein